MLIEEEEAFQKLSRAASVPRRHRFRHHAQEEGGQRPGGLGKEEENQEKLFQTGS